MQKFLRPTLISLISFLAVLYLILLAAEFDLFLSPFVLFTLCCSGFILSKLISEKWNRGGGNVLSTISLSSFTLLILVSLVGKFPALAFPFLAFLLFCSGKTISLLIDRVWKKV